MIKVIGLGCSLKRTPALSNTEVLMENVVTAMRKHDEIEYEVLRIADYDNLKLGVEWDEGDGDVWPEIAQKILDAEALIFGTPIWIGHPSSVAQHVIERMDSFLFKYNDKGQKLPYNRVAGVCVTGNEDGGHLVFSQVAQALIDAGFTVPPEARAYWTGWTDKSPGVNYAEAGQDNEYTNYMLEHMANSMVHVAKLLRENPIPAIELDAQNLAGPQGRAARGFT